MNQKQTNILITMALFLVFDLLSIFLYQQVKTKTQLSEEKSQELIANYNVKLDSQLIEKLALVIDPSLQSKPKNDSQKPEIAILEPKEQKITVELYNANGVDNNASQTASMLTESGFTVVSIKNADNNSAITTIVYQPDNESLAQDLQSLLKTYYNDIRLDSSIDDKTKIKIVLGQPAQLKGGEESE